MSDTLVSQAMSIALIALVVRGYTYNVQALLSPARDKN